MWKKRTTREERIWAYSGLLIAILLVLLSNV